MAIQLYRPGTIHTVNGIQCEAKNFDAYQLDTKLKEGWYTKPEDFPTDEPEVKETEKELHPVRAAAKEAGIEGWETKRIATLEAALNGDQD